MDKFEEELKNVKNPWIIRIGNYLKTREDMYVNLKKENKSLDECFRYVLDELSKQAVREGQISYASGDDEEIYVLAVHYYDEDDIKVPKKLNFTTNANGTAQMKPKTSKSNDKVISKVQSKKVKKEKISEGQISFDL